MASPPAAKKARSGSVSASSSAAVTTGETTGEAATATQVCAQCTSGSCCCIREFVLKCTSCGSLFAEGAAVYQCGSEKHFGCADCWTSVAWCDCGTGCTSAKTLEGLTATMLRRCSLPCKYLPHGCTARLPYFSCPDHERDCSFQPMLCGVRGCTLLAPGDALLQHIRAFHGLEVRSEEEGRPFQLQLLTSSCSSVTPISVSFPGLLQRPLTFLLHQEMVQQQPQVSALFFSFLGPVSLEGVVSCEINLGRPPSTFDRITYRSLPVSHTRDLRAWPGVFRLYAAPAPAAAASAGRSQSPQQQWQQQQQSPQSSQSSQLQKQQHDGKIKLAVCIRRR